MFHVKHEAWTPDPSALGLTLSPSQVEQLRIYGQELLKVAVPRGLIARSDRDRLWGRHIADGLRAALGRDPRRRAAFVEQDPVDPDDGDVLPVQRE